MIFDQKSIASAIAENASKFAQLIENQSVANFEKPLLAGKWSAGQHLEHLIRSVDPLTKAYRLPGWILRWKFGRANRPSRNFDALRARYAEKYAAVPPGFTTPFAGREVAEKDRNDLLKRFKNGYETLARLAEKASDKKLDSCILPHPLLGKLTLRELLFFTIFHVELHREMVERDAAAADITR